MKRFLLITVLLLFSPLTIFAQIRFSANANVYNEKNGQKIGMQHISANIGADGRGSMTLGSLTLKAIVTNKRSFNSNNMEAYAVTLRSQDGKTVDLVITKRKDRSYTVLVYYAEGTLRYDFSA